MPIQQFFSYIMGIRPSKKMFWFSDNGFQKKGKEGRVFIFFFYFQRVKNITQTSLILLFWQTNNTIVFTRRDLDFPTDTSYISLCYIFRDIFDDLKDHYALHTANKKEMVKK
jgi:hypothetical protein